MGTSPWKVKHASERQNLHLLWLLPAREMSVLRLCVCGRNLKGLRFCLLSLCPPRPHVLPTPRPVAIDLPHPQIYETLA